MKFIHFRHSYENSHDQTKAVKWVCKLFFSQHYSFLKSFLLPLITLKLRTIQNPPCFTNSQHHFFNHTLFFGIQDQAKNHLATYRPMERTATLNRFWTPFHFIFPETKISKAAFNSPQTWTSFIKFPPKSGDGRRDNFFEPFSIIQMARNSIKDPLEW